LHPPGFRRRFEDEMLLIFDETVARGESTAPLLGDALVSLFRRWVLTRAGRSTGSHPLQPRTWWLLALCGVLDAMFSGMILFMQGPDGYLTLRTGVYGSSNVHLGVLALAAGAVTIAAGIWSHRDRRSWLVVLNGLGCSALGLILLPTGIGFGMGFQTFALLIVLTALSIGIYELATVRTLLRHAADQWVLGGAGVVSLGFACAFLAFAYGWIQLEPRPLADFLWFGSYFGFSGIFKLWLALRLHGPGPFCAAKKSRRRPANAGSGQPWPPFLSNKREHKAGDLYRMHDFARCVRWK
jgi:uncharacterized membrane protein HdeD (DUF308 family)